jgi:hypothetical protein
LLAPEPFPNLSIAPHFSIAAYLSHSNCNTSYHTQERQKKRGTMGTGDYPLDKRLTVRKATLADLDAITTVAQEGFPDDPEFDYRFPYRHQYPEDNRRWVREEYREYLEQPEKYAVVVVTAKDNDDKPVALSVWDMKVLARHQGGGRQPYHLRDLLFYSLSHFFFFFFFF